GVVERRLAIIAGFVARVHARDIPALERATGVRSVTRDRRLHLAATSYSATQDPYSMYSIEQEIGPRAFNKTTGAGVDVALIDSGVTPVTGLAGQVVYGPDLSTESQNVSVANLDTYGHGTFMAGIIAG